MGTEPKQRFDADGKMLFGEAVLGDGGGGRLLSLRLPKVSKGENHPSFLSLIFLDPFTDPQWKL